MISFEKLITDKQQTDRLILNDNDEYYSTRIKVFIFIIYKWKREMMFRIF